MFKEAEKIRVLEEAEEEFENQALLAAAAMFQEAEKIRRLEESEEASEQYGLRAAAAMFLHAIFAYGIVQF